jgi:hypothetical protein
VTHSSLPEHLWAKHGDKYGVKALQINKLMRKSRLTKMKNKKTLRFKMKILKWRLKKRS